MYKVITVEHWKNHITESEYAFKNWLHMYRFIQLCEQDGIKYRVIKAKDNNVQKGA